VVREDGKLVGIITDRDICMAAYTRGGGLSQYLVASAMSKHVISVHPDQPVADAEKLMAEHQLHRIPIVDADNKPLGIVSTNDLAREATRPGGRLHSSVARVLQTIASICAPRPHAPATRAA
jgi:CBS-domain-containing membrane protein